MGHIVKFIDSGREPQCKPNPAYPTGMTADLARGAPSCTVKLPYPAPRCGLMHVTCETCGMTCACTVAGRIDDPHTMIIPCQKPEKVN